MLESCQECDEGKMEKVYGRKRTHCGLCKCVLKGHALALLFKNTKDHGLVSDLPLLSLQLQMFLLWSVLSLHWTCEDYQSTCEKHQSIFKKIILSHQVYYYYQEHDQNQFLSAGQDLHKVLSDKEQKVISFLWPICS